MAVLKMARSTLPLESALEIRLSKLGNGFARYNTGVVPLYWAIS